MKAKIYLPFILLVVFVLSISGCSLLGKRYEKKETVEYKISTTGKTKLSVSNVNGDIKLLPGTADSVLVVKCIKTEMVKKKDLDKPIEDLVIDLDTASQEISISSHSEHKVGSFLHFGWYEREGIDYEISLPKSLQADLNTTNGHIDAENLGNTVKLTTVNGKIKVKNLYGVIDLNATNGSISCDLDSTNGFKAETVNGRINLDVDSTFSAKITADVVNGKISTEGLNFTTLNSDKKHFTGTIGNSDKEVSLQTVNGSIHIDRK